MQYDKRVCDNYLSFVRTRVSGSLVLSPILRLQASIRAEEKPIFYSSQNPVKKHIQCISLIELYSAKLEQHSSLSLTAHNGSAETRHMSATMCCRRLTVYV